MKIDILAPIWLLLLPPVLFLLWYIAKKSGYKGSLFVKRCMLIMRSIICILLIFALAGISIAGQQNATTTIFLVDSSASTAKAQEEIDLFLKQAETSKKSTDAVGILSFAETAALEGNVSKETSLTAQRTNYFNADATNITSALELGVASLSEDTRKRIVILSDGLETQGDIAAFGKQLANIPGMTVDVFLLANSDDPEVQLSQLTLPKNIRLKTDYEITMQIDANIDQQINVKLFKNDELIADQLVDVVSGKNNLLFHDNTNQGGNVIYRGEISSVNDTISRNNTFYAYTHISDVPQILLIEKQATDNGLFKILESTSASVSSVLPAAAPTNLSELSRYDAIILCNVALKELPKEFPDVLEVYLKTNGGGLFVTGGEEAFALGGYMDTKLEEILPVDMDLKTEGEEPSLGMVMVIDHSGSMSQSDYGVSKIEMAKEAAIRSVSQFKQGDSLGVIAFDDQATWTVPIQEAGSNQESIINSIGKIQPGGGTSILPALTEAFTMLNQTQAKQKHILLLTDGQAEQSGYDSVLTKMNQSGITLSTIAVGQDADAALLKKLAEKGNGRYYQTDVFSDLPEIFAKETVLAGKEYINYKKFYPVLQDMPELLGSVAQMPQLGGFIATTAKPRADIVLKTDDEQPILAFWQYGIGRSGVWTSDVNGRFSADWLQTQEGARILLNAVSYVTKKPPQADINVTTTPTGEKSLIRLETPFVTGYPKLKAEIVDAKGNPIQADEPKAVAPGVYKFLADTKEGAYLLNLIAEDEQGNQEVFQTGFAVPYPDEFSINTGRGKPAMEQLAMATGGRVLENGSQVFEKEAPAISAPKNLSNILLWIALILFLIDVAFRRMPAIRFGAESIWKKCFQAEKKGKLKESQKNKKTSNKTASSPTEIDLSSTKKENTQNTEAAAKKSTAELLAKSRKNRNR